MAIKEKLVELLIKHWDTNMQGAIAHTKAEAAELIASGLCTDGVTVQEWISVKDRLPTMDSVVEKDFVLVCTENNEHLIVAVADVWRFRDFITHWMPLPELPKGEGK